MANKLVIIQNREKVYMTKDGACNCAQLCQLLVFEMTNSKGHFSDFSYFDPVLTVFLLQGWTFSNFSYFFT